MEQLPAGFVSQIGALIGEKEYKDFENALCGESPVSIRVNAAKGFGLNKCEDDSSAKVPWCDTGYYLQERPSFTFDPLFHAGAYYVQEASSMFIEQVIKKYITKPVVSLDLCAAPGGKSTHIRSLLPQGSLLVCNEIIRSRSHILAENLMKWGHPGIVVTNNEPSAFSSFEDFFDVVFTDVPCSGEGMFRKDAGAIKEWSPGNVEMCFQRQREIIADIWSCLKPGGILVYSTCTYNIKEDEENIAWIMDEFGAQPLTVDVSPEWGVTSNLTNEDFPVYRFFPHKTRGEGFFLAALRKPGEESSEHRMSPSMKSGKKQPKQQAIPQECKSWLKRSECFSFETKGTAVIAYPKETETTIQMLKQKLNITHAGIVLAEIKGKDLIPQHSLAMSTELNMELFPSVHIDYKQAISYLRNEAITLGHEVSRGYLLLIYEGTPIGFVKNIGNRANNLYPQEWRIRSGYTSPATQIVSRI